MKRYLVLGIEGHEFITHGATDTDVIIKFWRRLTDRAYACDPAELMELPVFSSYALHEGQASNARIVDAGEAFRVAPRETRLLVQCVISCREGKDSWTSTITRWTTPPKPAESHEPVQHFTSLEALMRWLRTGKAQP